MASISVYGAEGHGGYVSEFSVDSGVGQTWHLVAVFGNYHFPSAKATSPAIPVGLTATVSNTTIGPLKGCYRLI